MGRPNAKRRQHADWLRAIGGELSGIGLPLRVFETAERWEDFLENGHLHWHADAGAFSFEDLSPEQLQALHRFLEREQAQGRPAAPLLEWIRLRAAPGVRSAARSVPATADQAIEWLRSRAAPAWLVRHHELVLEAAREVVSGLRETTPQVAFDAEHVLLGAALHDVGKIDHPSEMHSPGHAHEPAGEELLLREGFPERVARACTTHATWSEPRAKLEDRLIALADKLWKGKRDAELEGHLVQELADQSGRPMWEVFGSFDTLCEQIAADGPRRLRRSEVSD